MTDVLLYDVLGNNWRWGQDDHGVYTLASDVSTRLKYKQTKDALALVDEDEKALVKIPISIRSGRNDAGQDTYETQMRKQWVLYEDGIMELIFRSSLPEAKAIKKRVKQILREIREHGAYVSPDITPQQSIRLLEKIDYKAVLDALKFSQGYETLPQSAFANMQNGFYKATIGTTASDFKRKRGIKPRESVKDYLTDEELSKMQGLSMMIIGRLKAKHPNGIYTKEEFGEIFHEVIQMEFKHRSVPH